MVVDKTWRRKATAIIAIVLSALAVVAVFFSHPQQGVAVLSDISSTGVAGIKGGSVGSLDDKLSEILKAEKKAAGAIEVIWKQTNDLPESMQLRDEEEVDLPLNACFCFCIFRFKDDFSILSHGLNESYGTGRRRRRTVTLRARRAIIRHMDEKNG